MNKAAMKITLRKIEWSIRICDDTEKGFPIDFLAIYHVLKILPRPKKKRPPK